MTDWVTPEDFVFICDSPELFPDKYRKLQALVKEECDLDLTIDNWQKVYKIYKLKFKLARAVATYNRTLGQ